MNHVILQKKDLPHASCQPWWAVSVALGKLLLSCLPAPAFLPVSSTNWCWQRSVSGPCLRCLLEPGMWCSPCGRAPTRGQAHCHPTPGNQARQEPAVVPHGSSPRKPWPPPATMALAGPESGSPASGTKCSAAHREAFQATLGQLAPGGTRQTWP